MFLEFDRPDRCIVGTVGPVIDGVQYRIPDSNQLDRASRKLLERFL